MSPPILKFCGLKTARDGALASELGATWLGFVLAPMGPRRVSPEQAGALRDALPAGTHARTVALLVDPEDAVLETLVPLARPDMLQLHGAETPERCAEIKARFGLPVIKALGIAGADDVAQAAAFGGAADWLLLDAKPPTPSASRHEAEAEAKAAGGHGRAFDWTLLSGLNLETPWLLAGGLTPETVPGAWAAAQACPSPAAGLDVSSGIEMRRGVKDEAAMRAFAAAFHGAALGEKERQ